MHKMPSLSFFYRSRSVSPAPKRLTIHNMVPAQDHASVVATVIIVEEVLLAVGLSINEWVIARSATESAARKGPHRVPALVALEGVDYPIEDDRLLELFIRANDAIVAGIDAINLAALAIVALPAAFSIFEIDKLSGNSMVEIAVLLPLAISISLGLRAYVFASSREEERVEESIDSERFLMYYSQQGRDAIADTIRAVIEISKTNAAIRAKKKKLCRWATFFFVLALLVVVVASKLPKAGYSISRANLIVTSAAHRAIS
jgi:hypothetical protein